MRILAGLVWIASLALLPSCVAQSLDAAEQSVSGLTPDPKCTWECQGTTRINLLIWEYEWQVTFNPGSAEDPCFCARPTSPCFGPKPNEDLYLAYTACTPEPTCLVQIDTLKYTGRVFGRGPLCDGLGGFCGALNGGTETWTMGLSSAGCPPGYRCDLPVSESAESPTDCCEKRLDTSYKEVRDCIPIPPPPPPPPPQQQQQQQQQG